MTTIHTIIRQELKSFSETGRGSALRLADTIIKRHPDAVARYSREELAEKCCLHSMKESIRYARQIERRDAKGARR